jgi:predicted nucleic acid-binding protein
MKSPSRLQADGEPLFLDTSVVINLIASGRVVEISRSLGRPLVIDEEVMREVKRDPRDHTDGVTLMRRLTQDGTFQLTQMNEEQVTQFVDLVGAASPDDLGDGEAAALALALPGGNVAIDEKKARKICARDFPQLGVYCSLDILASPQIYAAFGEPFVADLVQQAIKVGRMRVPFEWRSFTMALAGSTAADR